MKIGWVLTGSFCTIPQLFDSMSLIQQQGHQIIPIMSYHTASLNTRFMSVEDLMEKITNITGNTPLATIPEVEPIGPQKLLDILLVAPCTGNTMAKLAHGITDTPALMACKSHLRNQRPVVLALATNDGLSANAQNIGQLLNRKNIYFVPFGQDDPQEKETSLQSRFLLISDTLQMAGQGKQIQPLLLQQKECLLP